MDLVLAGSELGFHQYELIHPTADVAALLEEIDQDPTSIFWG
jgi:hypothetical protein